MNPSTFQNLTGSDGMFTFNFFCESLLGALHTLAHVMEDNQLDMPAEASQIPDMLAEMGNSLSDDYCDGKIDLSRFKDELLDFHKTAFAIDDQMTSVIANGDDTLQYYYFVYMQGISLFLPNMLDAIGHDLPEDVDPADFMNEILSDFAALTETQQ